MEEALAGSRAQRSAVNCLLLFDFLAGHVNKDRDRYSPVIANAAKLLTAARVSGAVVAHARADHPPGAESLNIADSENRPPLITRGTPEAEIVRELLAQSQEIQVPKRRWSAFHGTSLDAALRAKGVETIILCGGSTEIGIASTAYGARDLGYNLVIVSDACTSSKRAVHDQLMREVFPRLARVRSTIQALEMLKPRA